MAFKMSTRAGLAAMLSLAVAGAAFAQNEPMPKGQPGAGAKAAHLRHEKFEQMGKVFKSLNDELKKDAPAKTVVASNAATLRTLAGQLPTWFPRGSGKEARAKSEAKADIWTDAAGFNARAANLQVQTSKLHLLAQAGDMAAVRAQVRATGGACKACHEKYRDEKK